MKNLFILVLACLISNYSFSQKAPITGKISVCAGICKYIVDPNLAKGCPEDYFPKSQNDYANYIAGLFTTKINTKPHENVTFIKNDLLKIDTLPFKIPSYSVKKLIKADGEYYLYGGDNVPVCKLSPFKLISKLNKELEPVDAKPENFDKNNDYTLILWSYTSVVQYWYEAIPFMGHVSFFNSFIYALYSKDGKLVFMDYAVVGAKIGYHNNDPNKAFKDMCEEISDKLVEDFYKKLK